MSKFIELITDVKLVVSTVMASAAMIYGSYEIGTHFFVSTAYAQEQLSKFEKAYRASQRQIQYNTEMLIEMRLIRFEEKIAKGEQLTPREKVLYDKLKEQLISYTNKEVRSD